MNLIGTKTLFKKETRRFWEVWTQTLLAPVITNLLFLTIFGVSLASRGSFFEGFEYLQALIPGLIAFGLFTNAFQSPMSSLMLAKYTNIITELLIIPLSGLEIMMAYGAAAVLRGVLIGIITFAVGMFFVSVPLHSLWIILLFTIMTGGIFSSFGMLVGIIAKDFDQASVVFNFILTPLIYMSGVFFPLALLPDFIEPFSKLNPVYYMIDGFRYGFLGVGESPIAISFLVTFAVFLLFVIVTSWVFHTGYKLKT